MCSILSSERFPNSAAPRECRSLNAGAQPICLAVTVTSVESSIQAPVIRRRCNRYSNPWAVIVCLPEWVIAKPSIFVASTFSD